jgi:endonuclease/exonuclease/phosphatase family metal-dependent hydrolase
MKVCFRFSIFAICVLSCAVFASAAERVRIMQFNAEFLAAPGTKTTDIVRFKTEEGQKQHCEGVASVIEAFEPDVINLCEVTNAETIQYIVNILHEKGLKDYEGWTAESDDQVTGHHVAMISRRKPDEVDGKAIRSFLSPPGDFTWREKFVVQDPDGKIVTNDTNVRRHALYFFTIGGRKLGFLGLHLKSNPTDPAPNAQRTAESKICRKLINEQIVAKGYTPIVLGDLNDYDPDVPDADESRSTKTKVLADLKDYDPNTPGPELVNVAERMVRQSDRYSEIWDRNRNLLDDTGDVHTMLDHILIPKQMMPLVKRATILHVTDLHLSDHFPVLVDLELP